MCTKANYGSDLRAAATYHANEAFRLNEHENCRLVLKYSNPFELYRVTVLAIGSLNFMATTV